MVRLKPPTMRAQVESLQNIIEKMATEHVILYGPTGDEIHPDWCPLCRLEKAEQIGSPNAIADWIERDVVPIMGVRMNLPDVTIERGVVQQVGTVGDLLKTLREWR